MHIDEIAEKLTPMFKEKDLLLVLLFGSSVSGKIHKGSDIDLEAVEKAT
jgi:predicted nucleotidyltransferase